jgi:hypothetical protein
LHINLSLDFINGQPKKAVEYLVSVIKPAAIKAESNLEIDKPDLKKYFLEFVAYMKKMAITHDEHCVLPPGPMSRNIYVDDNSCLLKSSLPLIFYTMSSNREIYM